jgi:hypothetical protein
LDQPFVVDDEVPCVFGPERIGAPERDRHGLNKHAVGSELVETLLVRDEDVPWNDSGCLSA